MRALLGVYILLYNLFSAVILCGSSSLLGLPRCLCGSLRLFSQTVDNLGGVVLSRLKSPYIAGATPSRVGARRSFVVTSPPLLVLSRNTPKYPRRGLLLPVPSFSWRPQSWKRLCPHTVGPWPGSVRDPGGPS